MLELTQVEKCKKVGSLLTEFARLRDNERNKINDQLKFKLRNIKPLKED